VKPAASAGQFLASARSRLLPASIPLRFFGAAVVFHLLAWLALLPGAQALPRFDGGLGWPLAALHLITLGVLVMSAIGASLQLLPVATRQPVRWQRAPALVWWLYLPGVAAVTLGMGLGLTPLLGAGAVLVLLALTLFAWLLAANLRGAQGMPAVVVHGWVYGLHNGLLEDLKITVANAGEVAAAYGLRSEYRATDSTAFFPAEVLVQLYGLIGDVRVVMSALAIATEVLLVAAILAGILMLMRLYRQRFAVLRALGASRTYVLAVAWSFSFGLIALGSVLGLGVAAALVGVVSGLFSDASGIAMTTSIGWPEVWLALGLAAIGAVLSILPAALLYRRPVVEALRSA